MEFNLSEFLSDFLRSQILISAEEPSTPISPPVGLKAIVLSPKTILVTWSDSTLGRNQRITDNRYYTIRYKATTAKKAKFVNSTDLNMHVDDLKPNTEYEFSVKVIKGRRQSSWGMIAVNRTFESGMENHKMFGIMNFIYQIKRLTTTKVDSTYLG